MRQVSFTNTQLALRDVDSSPSSSLQRIESTTLKLEKGVNDIKGLIRRSTNDSSSAPPVLSVLDGEKVFAVSFSAKLMKNAEGGRKWSAIGVDEWIQGGRWWLLKVGSSIHFSRI